LSRHQLATVIIAGYGPGPLVTPVADAARDAVTGADLRVHDVLRVEDGRYWSYLCREPSCCPAEGVPLDVAAHPAAQVLAKAGQPVRADRAALAATIAPLSGTQANAMREATRWAERGATRLITRAGPRALDAPGRAAVQSAIRTYRDGGAVTDPGRHAWLALVLASLPVRDDAWARMDPAHRDAHRRLWTDLVRRAQPGYVAAPAPCWPSLRGSPATARWPTSRSPARSPTPPATRWHCCCKRPWTPACLHRRPSCR
jgi:hypothetical protein